MSATSLSRQDLARKTSKMQVGDSVTLHWRIGGLAQLDDDDIEPDDVELFAGFPDEGIIWHDGEVVAIHTGPGYHVDIKWPAGTQFLQGGQGITEFPPTAEAAFQGRVIECTKVQIKRRLEFTLLPVRPLDRPAGVATPAASIITTESFLDAQAGVMAPLQSIAPGLRIPAFIDDSSKLFYPHMWKQPAAWVAAIRAKFSEFSCTITSQRVKQDVDTDIEVIERMIAIDDTPTTKQGFKPTFFLIARLLGVLLMTSQMSNTAASAALAADFDKAWAEGRVDFAALLTKQFRQKEKDTTSPDELAGFRQQLLSINQRLSANPTRGPPPNTANQPKNGPKKR